MHQGAQRRSDGRAKMIVGYHQLPVIAFKNYAGVAVLLAWIFEISPVPWLEFTPIDRFGNTMMLQTDVGCVITYLMQVTVVFITDLASRLQTIKKHIGTGRCTAQ